MEAEIPEAHYYRKRLVIPDEAQANQTHQKGMIGKPLSGGRLQLAPIEALHLLDREKIRVIEKKSGEKLNFEELSSKLSKDDPDLMLKFPVYQDLKSRGLVVKTGLKYGAHFRVYARGEGPSTGHAPYLVHAISEDASLTTQELSRAVRLAHSVKKKMVFAVVDNEGDVTYYSLKREKL